MSMIYPQAKLHPMCASDSMRNVEDESLQGVEYSMHMILTLILALSLAASHVYGCEEVQAKPDCPEPSEPSEPSEFTWNPANEYATDQLMRFYDMESLIDEQFSSSDYPSTRILIAEYLVLASVYKDNWNYGNAIYHANRVLGLMSYHEGDIDTAARYLVSSSKTTGSPQLDTFGPARDLADLLLQAGKTQEVKLYLRGVQNFWEMDSGAIDLWLEEIEAGEQPTLSRFGANKYNGGRAPCFGSAQHGP